MGLFSYNDVISDLSFSADYNEEEAEAEAKHDDTPSLSFSTTETLSSWMREANMDADIQSYTKSSILRRDEYFFRLAMSHFVTVDSSKKLDRFKI